MLFEPTLGGFVIGTDALDLTPESSGVIHLSQVHQLMQDQIVTDELRSLNEPPIQRDCPAPRARTPTRFLISHREARDESIRFQDETLCISKAGLRITFALTSALAG
jgi:hypothetical protein